MKVYFSKYDFHRALEEDNWYCLNWYSSFNTLQVIVFSTLFIFEKGEYISHIHTNSSTSCFSHAHFIILQWYQTVFFITFQHTKLHKNIPKSRSRSGTISYSSLLGYECYGMPKWALSNVTKETNFIYFMHIWKQINSRVQIILQLLLHRNIQKKLRAGI